MFIPFMGYAEVRAKDIDAVCTFSMKARYNGELRPHIHDIFVDFGGTELYHPNKFTQWFYRQYFDATKYILMAALNTFGVGIFNLDIESWVQEKLHH